MFSLPANYNNILYRFFFVNSLHQFSMSRKNKQIHFSSRHTVKKFTKTFFFSQFLFDPKIIKQCPIRTWEGNVCHKKQFGQIIHLLWKQPKNVCSWEKNFLDSKWIGFALRNILCSHSNQNIWLFPESDRTFTACFSLFCWIHRSLFYFVFVLSVFERTIDRFSLT